MKIAHFFQVTAWVTSLISHTLAADGLGPPDDAALMISELSAASGTRVVDEDGDLVDWLEIWNRSAASVALEGWHLSDDPETPEKWAFPAGDLAPGAYVLVHASGKDRAVFGEALHCNFKLSASGEYLALSGPEGNTIHAFDPAFPKQRAGMTYGLAEDGTFRYFPKPTPESANIGRSLCFVADTRFSVKRGFYETPFEVEITCDTPDAVIRYTTDGSEPFEGTLFGGAKGSIYSGPITIDKTTVLRAKATRPAWESSNIDTQTYLFLNDVIRQSPNGETPPAWPTGSVNGQVFDFGMDPDIVDSEEYSKVIIPALRSLPSMSLVMDQVDLTDRQKGIYTHATNDGIEWERPGSLELISPDGTEGFHINAGIRLRGGFSRSASNPKHSFRLFFREEYGDDRLRYPLFGDEGVDDFKKLDFRTAQNYAWSLNSSNDARRNTFLREIFARDSQRAMGQPYTRSRYYHLYLNGLYWGLYMSQERAGEDFAESYFGGDSKDYDVIKVEAGPYTIYATAGVIDDFYALHELVKGELTEGDYLTLQGKNAQGEDDLSITKHIDVDNLIDYMMTIFYVGSFDAPLAGSDRANNFYAVRSRVNRDGWRFFAHDTEHSMMNIREDRMGPYPAGSQRVHFNPQYLHQQLMQTDGYRLAFADHVQKAFFNNGVFTVEAARDRWQARQDEIDLAIIGESARWGDQHVSRPYNREDWLAECEWVLDAYMSARTDIVYDQLKKVGLTGDLQVPVFSQHGGTVVEPETFRLKFTVGTLFRPQNGDIYYTIDGPDPMRPDGSIEPSAILYDRKGTGVSVAASGTYRVRLMNDGKWSPINVASFAVGVGDSPYTDWKVAHSIQDDAEDGDQDGLSAFLEYAIGTDPGSPSLESSIRIAREAENVFIVSVLRAATDVEAALEYSDTLVGWSTPETLTLMEPEQISPTQQWFRFRVTTDGRPGSFRAKYHLNP